VVIHFQKVICLNTGFDTDWTEDNRGGVLWDIMNGTLQGWLYNISEITGCEEGFSLKGKHEDIWVYL